MHALSICAIFKDETPYFEEWLDFHESVGVEHFYLYDNDSGDAFLDLLRPRIDGGRVTLYGISGKGMQFAAYQHCLEHHREHSRWIAFIDLDEFLFAPREPDLRRFLRDFEDEAAVVANWLMFGSDGHQTRPAAGVLASYTRRAEVDLVTWEQALMRAPDLPRDDPQSYWPVCSHVKSVVNTRFVAGLAWSPHHFAYRGGRAAVDAAGLAVDGPWADPARIDHLRVHHYFSRSIGEFRAKLARGRASSGSHYSLDEQFARERLFNAVEDRTILTFRDAPPPAEPGDPLFVVTDDATTGCLRAAAGLGRRGDVRRTADPAEIVRTMTEAGRSGRPVVLLLGGAGIDAAALGRLLDSLERHPSVGLVLARGRGPQGIDRLVPDDGAGPLAAEDLALLPDLLFPPEPSGPCALVRPDVAAGAELAAEGDPLAVLAGLVARIHHAGLSAPVDNRAVVRRGAPVIPSGQESSATRFETLLAWRRRALDGRPSLFLDATGTADSIPPLLWALNRVVTPDVEVTVMVEPDSPATRPGVLTRLRVVTAPEARRHLLGVRPTPPRAPADLRLLHALALFNAFPADGGDGPDRVRRLAAASADALLFTGAEARDRFAARVAVPSRSLLLPLSATADPVAAERSARALIGLCREAVAWSCANWAGRDLLLS